MLESLLRNASAMKFSLGYWSADLSNRTMQTMKTRTEMR